MIKKDNKAKNTTSQRLRATSVILHPAHSGDDISTQILCCCISCMVGSCGLYVPTYSGIWNMNLQTQYPKSLLDSVSVSSHVTLLPLNN